MIKTLTDIIANSSQKFSDKEAFKYGGTSISYAELELKTNQLGNYLVGKGVRKGDRVGIYMNRCLETVIAIYGIMKSGAAYVPLDPFAPHERSLFLLKDCNIEIIVGIESLTHRIQKIVGKNSPIKLVVGIKAEIAIPSASWKTIFDEDLVKHLPIQITEEDLAYIMYTSGSTGLPKGIMHSHRSAIAYAKLSAQLFHVTPKDRVGNHAPLHFDISTFGYFTAPLAGATTIIISDAHTKLPASLLTLMENEKLTIWYSVPLALIQLYLSGLLPKYELKTLKHILFGGENFTIKYLRALMQSWPQAKFYNIYGPAEVNQCTHYPLQKMPYLDSQIPIGKMWGTNKYKILNENNQELDEIGAIGELAVKSDTMMMGYWNNPELTKKSIYLEDSPSNKINEYFKTGDLVKMDTNGNLVFMGRGDRQVKLRGYRIELDEIETVLEMHDKINSASVCLLETDSHDKILFAGVIVTEPANITSNELILFCKQKLPQYMVPNRIEIMQEFPKTSSGKIDLLAFKNKIMVP
ncbi:amino acid adenylation domain-containing protein [Arenibacter palladensis]|uniref:amino acid adenylation domain-containing protein n=1 Tax=Arenibacter palladensis TaxID=237373 RepID=UPI002FCFA91D